MLKLPARILVVSIILHHLYIVFLNTSSIHGLVVIDKLIWTAVLTLFLAGLIYFYLQEPAPEWYDKSLYLAIILGLVGSILRVFGVSVALVTYSILLVAIALLTTVPLIVHPHNQLRMMLLSIYSLEFLIQLSRTFNLTNFIQFIGPLVELAIVVGIIYYIYSLGFQFDELFIIILFTFIGWQVGVFVAGLTSQVPALIISTMFEQMLSVGQYDFEFIFLEFDAPFFLSLHIALLFCLIMVQILARRSIRAAAIIMAGIDMTYPPIMAFRAIAILAFLRGSLPSSEIKGENTQTPEKRDLYPEIIEEQDISESE